MRFSSGTLLLGIFAVMFGLLGAYAVRKELHKPAEKKGAVAVAKKVETVTVPVASQNLEAGRKLTLGDVVILKLTAAQMKAQKISGSFMGNPKQIIGRIVKTAIREGATFDSPDFYPEGIGPSLSDRLKPGYRAVTITVDQDAAVAGFAIPGSVVDVLFRADAVTASNGSAVQNELPERTIALIERTEVLALNKNTSQAYSMDSTAAANPSEKTSVTLAVTPRQAVALQVAEGHGTLSLSLRGKNDLVASSNPTGETFVSKEVPNGAAPQEIPAETESFRDPNAVNENLGESESASSESLPITLDDLLSRPNRAHHTMEIYRGRQMKQVHFHNFERTTPQESVISHPNPVAAIVPQKEEQPSLTAPIKRTTPRIVSPHNATAPAKALMGTPPTAFN